MTVTVISDSVYIRLCRISLFIHIYYQYIDIGKNLHAKLATDVIFHIDLFTKVACYLWQLNSLACPDCVRKENCTKIPEWAINHQLFTSQATNFNFLDLLPPNKSRTSLILLLFSALAAAATAAIASSAATT